MSAAHSIGILSQRCQYCGVTLEHLAQFPAMECTGAPRFREILSMNGGAITWQRSIAQRHRASANG